MSDKRASEEALAALHSQVARSLAELCSEHEEVEEVTDAEGVVTTKVRKVKPAPAALAVARAFLKDNNITATPEQSSAVDELRAKLQGKKPSAAENAEAVRMVQKGLLQ